MPDSSNRDTREFQIMNDAILVPVAILISGDDIVSLIVRTAREHGTYYTMLTGPAREPTGWVDSDLLVTPAVAKHTFVRIPPDAGAPTFVWGRKIEGVRALEQWCMEHRNQLTS